MNVFFFALYLFSGIYFCIFFSSNFRQQLKSVMSSNDAVFLQFGYFWRTLCILSFYVFLHAVCLRFEHKLGKLNKTPIHRNFNWNILFLGTLLIIISISLCFLFFVLLCYSLSYVLFDSLSQFNGKLQRCNSLFFVKWSNSISCYQKKQPN